ncbi:hypothetical protein AOC36_09525 [Erysipelothrix larvae]|uniref:Phage tail tape measure protein domain-containing protein n=1 Tax=Erysipelothrix larvae TaxID=1514105 RepID=A0A109UHJ6_9FIRM|nr:hypothetical protein [Erysipelothrix larvae]AMC94213.1 hypothetical protein AOC36_09525 [Erysipelothrix larvae]
MAFELFKVLGSIVIEDKNALDTLKKADTEAKKNADSLNKVEDKMAGIGKKIIAAFSIAVITKFTQTIIETTAKLNAMDAQFDQVFGADATKMMEDLEEQSKELNIHVDRLKTSASKFGAQFKGAGMDATQALNNTDTAVRLAADGAAFYDKSLDDVTGSMASLMKGNFSAGDAIGVFTNATEMGRKAQEKFGLSWQELTEAQKQDLILQKIEETYELNGAMGQAARESSNWDNVTGNLSATWNRFLANIGQPVLNIATGLIEGLTDAVSWLGKNLNIVIPVVAALTAAFLAQMIINTVSTAMSAYRAVSQSMTVAQWLLNAAMNANPFGMVAIAIGVLIGVGIALWKNWDSVTAWMMGAWSKLSSVVGNGVKSMNEFVSSGVRKVKDFFTGMWSSVNATFSNMVSGAKTKFNEIKKAIMNPIETAKTFVGNTIDKIKGFMNFKWEFPKLKMPHFKVTGSVNPLNWLKDGTPKLSVEWYAKGGIMTKPTAFGLDGDKIMGGGEKGHEAILPLNKRTLSSIGDGIVDSTGMNTDGQEVTLSEANMSRFAHIVGQYLSIVFENFNIVLDDRILGKFVLKVVKQ